MKVSVENIDQVRKKITVLIPPEKIAEWKEEIYRELGKQAKVKGFRPGKVPRPVLVGLYKDYAEEETKKRMIEQTMYQALTEAQVAPVNEPIADFIEADGESGYTLDCEVLPEITIPVYKGIEIEVEHTPVTDEDVDKRLDGLREMHAQMLPKEGDGEAEKGDFVFIKYQGYSDGEAVKDVAVDSYPLELGNNTLMPEFEGALLGMKVGEEKDVEVTFAEDYPDKQFAGKPMLFKVHVNEIKKKRLPEINDDFAKDLNFDDLPALMAGLRDELEKEKDVAYKRTVSEKLLEKLVGEADIPIPPRLLKTRVDARIDEIKSKYQGQAMTAEEENMVDTNLRLEFGKREQEKIKAEIILSRIAVDEDIKVDEDDVEARIRRVANDARRSYEEVRGFYEQNDFMEGLRNSVLQEKTLDLLRETAVIKALAKETE